jgi:transposase
MSSLFGLPSLTALDRSSPTRIWLGAAPIDMRLGFDRLAELAARVTAQNPMSGREGQACTREGQACTREGEACTHLFLFRSRGGDRLKMLYWDKDGYVLWYKRLEEGTFKLPRIEAGVTSVELRASELAMLLDGIDLRSVKRVKRYQRS